MSKKTAEEVKEELKAIEEVAKELEVKDSILAGVMALKNWKNGKMVTKKEFENSLLEFLNKSI